MSETRIKTILQSFEPIGLEDINDAELMDRIDTKFIFNIEDLDDFLQTLKSNYDVLVIDDSVISRYNSLYFDLWCIFWHNDICFYTEISCCQ